MQKVIISQLVKLIILAELAKLQTPKLTFTHIDRGLRLRQSQTSNPFVLYLNWVLLHYPDQFSLFLNLYPEGMLKRCIYKTTIIQNIIYSSHLLIKVLLVKG